MLQLFMWIALAQSWNLISGLTGYVSFGHIAFFGMGAYTAGILIAKLGWPWLLASLAGGVGAMVLALVIGWPCLRLKGPYFAIRCWDSTRCCALPCPTSKGSTGGAAGFRCPRSTRAWPSTIPWGWWPAVTALHLCHRHLALSASA